jgi:hypothetical protein
MFCIKRCFLSQGNKLRQELGDWTTEPDDSNSEWQEYYDPATGKLYRKEGSSYNVHFPVFSRKATTRYATEVSSTSASVPTTAIPTLSSHNNELLTVRHGNVQGVQPTTITEPTSFQEHTAALPPWEADLMQSIVIPDLTEITSNLGDVKQPLYFVPDGGFRYEIGSYGVTSGSDTKVLLTNHGPAHGTGSLHSSFRAEEYGTLSALVILKNLIKFHAIKVAHGKTLRFFCDNIGVINRTKRHTVDRMTVKEYYAADVDVELQILNEIRELSDLGVETILAHVKGHQDGKTGKPKKDPKSYSREAQLNILADKLATYQLKQPSETEYCEFPANRASLLINGEYITSKCVERLRIAHLSQPLRHHMIKSFNWHRSVPDMIWWSTHGKALKMLSTNDRMRIQKFIHNNLPTNRRQHKIDEHIEDKCAACHLDGETDDHVLRCNSAGREALRTKWLQELSTFLRAKHTPTAVHDAIMGGFEAWLCNLPAPPLEELVPQASTTLKTAYVHQTMIGWQHFARGRLAEEWAELIQYQITEQRIPAKTMSAERWGVQIISVNWRHVLALWDNRNLAEHGENAIEQQNKWRDKLLIEAKYLQESQPPMSHVDRDWFDRPYEELAKLKVPNLLAWIRNARQLVRINRKEFRASLYRRQVPMPANN